METFLKEVAQKLATNHPNDLGDVIVVFNNRRSGLFLRKQFAEIEELQGKSFFLPQTIGIDELIERLGGMEIIPNEFLLFELFDIHKNTISSERKFETFEEFISFGEMMLSDFSEIDLYCVDAKELFGNLYDLKEIGEWSISGEKLTPFQQKYLSFYKSLYTYYNELHQKLLKKNQAYSGMAYRIVAENIDSMANKINCSKIYFVGFNALSECERKIIQCYTRLGIGSMITDGDTYYYDDPKQEAGHFLRKHKNDSNEEKQYAAHFEEHKEISIVSCPDNIIQTKYAGEILDKLIRKSDSSEKSIPQTAVVLSDETLLPAMLNALPKGINSANVTMGFPYTHSGIHSLVLKLFNLYNRVQNNRFYHADILDVLSDYFICKIHGTNNLRPTLRNYQIQKKIIRSSFEELERMASDIEINFTTVAFLFQKSEPSPEEFLNNIQTLIKLIHDSEILTENTKEKESIGCLLQLTRYFCDLQEEYHYIDRLQTLQKIYTRLAQRRNVAFYGEPLSGLQILGVLETRNLDFERVIMLSTNEGVLPSGRTTNTLIPLSLKNHFRIPTYSDKDAIYAYHFYRFLQRAKEIYLIYNSETEATGKGEASRFVMQIKEELTPKFANNIKLSEIVISSEHQNLDDSNISFIEKGDNVITRLQATASYGFSPSALNNYNSCPLYFYYNNVLGMEIEDELEDSLDQAELGTIVHNVLQEIYTKYIDRELDIESLTFTRNKEVNNLVTKEFEKSTQNGDIQEGKNRILYSIAVHQIKNLIDKDIQLIKGLPTNEAIVIKGLETPYIYNIQPNINVRGVADRIDARVIHNHNTETKYVRVVDYKTGKVDPKKDLEYKEGEIPGKWFQVMMYQLLFRRKNAFQGDIISGIQPLKMLHENFMPAQWHNKTIMTGEDSDEFEQILLEKIQEIMNPQKPFEANPQCKNCAYCVIKNDCSVGRNKKIF